MDGTTEDGRENEGPPWGEEGAGDTEGPPWEEGGSSDDFFAATPGLRRGLTGAGLLAMGVAALDAAVNGASGVAGFTLALGGGLAWTAWRERLPTGYRVGWLAWLAAAGLALAWGGRPPWLLPGLVGVGLGALVPTRRAVRRGPPGGAS